MKVFEITFPGIWMWLLLQILASLWLWLPALLLFVAALKKTPSRSVAAVKQHDFAIIVTAYRQVDLIDDVVTCILHTAYDRFMVYVVADNCDVSTLKINDERVIILRPETVLANNVKSHFYAMDRFVRVHDVVTIIDSDNIVDPEYLKELNNYFNKGYVAVQGVRAARNLNTVYACLDEAADILYRYIDKKLPFAAGSSATLAGSSMAFTTALYRECMQSVQLTGAGFDKVLQYEIIRRKHFIAFAETVILYDGKTAKSDQLVKQRARWINTWFKYWALGWKLLFQSIRTMDWNQLIFSLLLLRPPLFIMFGLMVGVMMATVFMAPGLLLLWLVFFILFFGVFFIALHHFKAGAAVYLSLIQVPRFVFYQCVALFKANAANKISVATEHDLKPYKKQQP